MQNHNDDTIKTSDTVLYKNVPLTLFERVVCERELETEQNCNILTPTLLAITVFLSNSPGLLNRGPGAPLCWELVFSSASYLQLQLLNRGPGGPASLGHVLIPASCHQLIELPPSFCGRHKSHSFNPSMVKVIFRYSSTGSTFYLHKRISYFDSQARSEVNIRHFSVVFECW